MLRYHEMKHNKMMLEQAGGLLRQGGIEAPLTPILLPLLSISPPVAVVASMEWSESRPSQVTLSKR